MGPPRRQRIKRLDIEIPAGQVTEANLTQLRDILQSHRGRRPVRIYLKENGARLAIEAGGAFHVSPGDGLLASLTATSFEKKISYREA